MSRIAKRQLIRSAVKDYYGVNIVFPTGVIDRIQKAIFSVRIPDLKDEEEKRIAYRVRDNLTDALYKSSFV